MASPQKTTAPERLSVRAALLLILLFGIAAYANTLNVPFHFDDDMIIVKNAVLRPPWDPVKIWQYNPTRFIAYASFALQFAFTGLALWALHSVNLLIHLLAAMAVFGIVRLLLRTPALEGAFPPDEQDLFALAPALLFLIHPVQTQAVTYIVQRMTSLATLFYLATLWMYLKARLEDKRHYRLTFLFMLAAMLTKEICFTLPFAILFTELSFFPVSKEEPLSKKLRRWMPFAAFLLLIPLINITNSSQLAQTGGAMGVLPSADIKTSRWDYLLTQFRVIRTYLRLLFFPVDQCIDYDYRRSSGMGDPSTWSAFFLLLLILGLAAKFFKKQRLASFGVFFFFLALAVESSLIPLPDVIFEHRLYLPMFGFALFVSSLLWQCARSPSRFLGTVLLIVVVLTGTTYARNEVWKSDLALWQDTVRKSPHKGRPYGNLGEAYVNEMRDDKTAVHYFLKAFHLGPITPQLLTNMAGAYIRLGRPKEAAYYQNLAFTGAQEQQHQVRDVLFYNQALLLKKEKKIPEAIKTLEQAIQMNPQNPLFYVRLGNLQLESGEEQAAVGSFQKAIKVAPLAKEGYEALALYYKEKGEQDKALEVLMEYLKLKKKKDPLLGN